jgi:hypothetical protein
VPENNEMELTRSAMARPARPSQLISVLGRRWRPRNRTALTGARPSGTRHEPNRRNGPGTHRTRYGSPAGPATGAKTAYPLRRTLLGRPTACHPPRRRRQEGRRTETGLPNKRMELTAPLGAAPGDGDVERGASRAFARRRRSSSAVFCGHGRPSQVTIGRPSW